MRVILAHLIKIPKWDLIKHVYLGNNILIIKFRVGKRRGIWENPFIIQKLWPENVNISDFLKEWLYFTSWDPCCQTPHTYFWIQNNLLSFSSTYSCQSLVSLAHQSVIAVCQLGTPFLSVIFWDKTHDHQGKGVRKGSNQRILPHDLSQLLPELFRTRAGRKDSFLFGQDPGKR